MEEIVNSVERIKGRMFFMLVLRNRKMPTIVLWMGR